MTLQKTISKKMAAVLRMQRPQPSPPLRELMERWFPRRQDGGLALQVIRLGSGYFAPGDHIWDEGPAQYRFTYVLSGSADYFSNGQCWHISPGCIFSRPVSEAYDIVVNKRGRLSVIVVNVSGAEAAQLHQDVFMDRLVVNRHTNSDQRQHWQRMRSIAQDGGGLDREQMIAAWLRIALLELKLQAATEPHVAAGGQARARFEQCRQYIDQHFIRIRSVAPVAYHVGIDPSHMGRLFKRFEGMTPHAYLHGLKMQYAGERLHESNIAIQALAQELGFDDPFVFSRSFRRIMGCSPSDWRRSVERVPDYSRLPST